MPLSPTCACPTAWAWRLLQRIQQASAATLRGHDCLWIGRERGRGAEGRRLRLPDQAGRPQAVPHRGGLGRSATQRGAGGAVATRRPRRRRRRSASAPAAAPATGAAALDAGRRLRADAAGQVAHRQGRARHGAGAGARRNGYRQGTRRARVHRLQPAQRRAVRRRQLRSHPGEPARGRVLRRTQGRLHRRRRRTATATSRRRAAARCSSTRSATCRWRCRPSCCARSRSAACGRSARRRKRGRRAHRRATHKDLQAEVQAGRFRQDLFFRLNVIEIACRRCATGAKTCPPCAPRCSHASRTTRGMPVPLLSPALLAALAAHPLHGNVRELENLLHRAVALNDGDELQLDGARRRRSDGRPPPRRQRAAGRCRRPSNPAPAARAGGTGRRGTRRPATYLDQQEREILVRALRESSFNRTAAAARLGLSLRQIRYRITRLGIVAPQGHDPAAEAPADDQRARSLWHAGWYRPARPLPSPNFGQRPAGAIVDLIVIHSISLPPGRYGGDEVQRLFTNRLDWDAHPYFQQIRGLRSRRISTCGAPANSGSSSAATTGPGMRARRAGGAEKTATISRSASNWRGWKAGPSRRRSTPRSPRLCADLAGRIRSRHRGPRAHRARPQDRSRPGLRLADLRARLGWTDAMFPRRRRAELSIARRHAARPAARRQSLSGTPLRRWHRDIVTKPSPMRPAGRDERWSHGRRGMRWRRAANRRKPRLHAVIGRRTDLSCTKHYL